MNDTHIIDNNPLDSKEAVDLRIELANLMVQKDRLEKRIKEVISELQRF